MWIDIDNARDEYGHELEAGFLVETLNTTTGRITYSLRERPLRTNRSGEPRLQGWCGETDNRSRYALGAWTIVRRNNAGDRARIRRLEGAELAAFLELVGHPDLASTPQK